MPLVTIVTPEFDNINNIVNGTLVQDNATGEIGQLVEVNGEKKVMLSETGEIANDPFLTISILPVGSVVKLVQQNPVVQAAGPPAS